MKFASTVRHPASGGLQSRRIDPVTPVVDPSGSRRGSSRSSSGETSPRGPRSGADLGPPGPQGSGPDLSPGEPKARVSCHPTRHSRPFRAGVTHFRAHSTHPTRSSGVATHSCWYLHDSHLRVLVLSSHGLVAFPRRDVGAGIPVGRRWVKTGLSKVHADLPFASMPHSCREDMREVHKRLTLFPSSRGGGGSRHEPPVGKRPGSSTRRPSTP